MWIQLKACQPFRLQFDLLVTPRGIQGQIRLLKSPEITYTAASSASLNIADLFTAAVIVAYMVILLEFACV